MEHYQQPSDPEHVDEIPEGFVFIEGPRPDWHKRVGQNPTYLERVQRTHPDAVLVASDRSNGYWDAYASPQEIPQEPKGFMARRRARKMGKHAARS